MRLKNIARIVIALALLVAGVALAQAPPFPVTLQQQLATRATNYTEVSLDKNMLQFASKFLNNKDDDDREAKRLIAQLDGVYVRTYKFDKGGQYSKEDLEAIRGQIAQPEWSPIVKERSRKGGEDSDIYLRVVNGDIHGLFVLSAEPEELTMVYILGPIRPEELTELSGNLGIPKIKMDKDRVKVKGKDGR